MLIAGVLLASSFSASQTRPVASQISKTTQEWSVSANLQKNDKIAIELRYGGDWPMGLFDPSDEDTSIGLLYVYVDVQGPVGNVTEFEVAFRLVSSTSTIMFWSINVTKQDGLDSTRLYNATTKKYGGIGGIVKDDGLYTVNVPKEKIFPPRDYPPASLAIFKQTTVTEYPYSSFLPGGVIVGVSGVIISVIGLRNPKRKTTLKKRTTHTLRRSAH